MTRSSQLVRSVRPTWPRLLALCTAMVVSTTRIANAQTESKTPLRIIVFGAHPDDPLRAGSRGHGRVGPKWASKSSSTSKA